MMFTVFFCKNTIIFRIIQDIGKKTVPLSSNGETKDSIYRCNAGIHDDSRGLFSCMQLLLGRQVDGLEWCVLSFPIAMFLFYQRMAVWILQDCPMCEQQRGLHRDCPLCEVCDKTQIHGSDRANSHLPATSGSTAFVLLQTWCYEGRLLVYFRIVWVLPDMYLFWAISEEISRITGCFHLHCSLLLWCLLCSFRTVIVELPLFTFHSSLFTFRYSGLFRCHHLAILSFLLYRHFGEATF